MMKARLSKIQNWEGLAKQAQFQPAVMAALCPISLRHLERYFTHQFSQSPKEWSRQLRCRMAHQLITEGWSNKAVVMELGFSNESHLCHEFKHFYGGPPQSFARCFGR
jgi:AraC-like DNA-binding protein